MNGIQEMKRVILKRLKPGHVGFRMEIGYNFNDLSKKFINIVRNKQVNLPNIILPPVQCTHPRAIELKKKKDIEKLLELRYGNNWHSRNDIGPFYQEVLSYNNPETEEESSAEEDNDDSETCNCLDEDPCNH